MGIINLSHKFNRDPPSCTISARKHEKQAKVWRRNYITQFSNFTLNLLPHKWGYRIGEDKHIQRSTESLLYTLAYAYGICMYFCHLAVLITERNQ